MFDPVSSVSELLAKHSIGAFSSGLFLVFGPGSHPRTLRPEPRSSSPPDQSCKSIGQSPLPVTQSTLRSTCNPLARLEAAQRHSCSAAVELLPKVLRSHPLRTARSLSVIFQQHTCSELAIQHGSAGDILRESQAHS